MDVGQPLTQYQPLDAKGVRERIDCHTSRLEARYHELIETLVDITGELTNALSAHLDRVREIAQTDIARTLGTIRRREQHQDAIQAQLLVFVGVMKSAYSELFDVLELPGAGSSTSSTTTHQSSSVQEVKSEAN